ncbi:MAG: zinc ribbon domain-containing protein [Verrucomicrobiales bacterium]|nr:zinc ribbon domain-containing protein [Verrucomicrobiales bacterium]
MPTYDYVCEKCEKEFEVFQSMKDPHLKKCVDKSCGGKVSRKIGTGAGIVFKGSGFYQTDYRSESYKSAAKKDSTPAAAPASAAGSSSTESKPAAKSGGGCGSGCGCH